MRTILLLFCAVVGGAAGAAPITFAFEGVGDFCICTNPGIVAPFQFSGTFTFDSDAIDETAPDPVTAVYTSSGGPYGMHWQVGPVSFDTDNVTITVRNNAMAIGNQTTPPGLSDEYAVLGTFATGDTGGEGFFQLIDCAAETFDSNLLPTTPPDLKSFSPSCNVAEQVVIHGPDGLQELTPDILSVPNQPTV